MTAKQNLQASPQGPKLATIGRRPDPYMHGGHGFLVTMLTSLQIMLTFKVLLFCIIECVLHDIYTR
jgi:hypothetical protein